MLFDPKWEVQTKPDVFSLENLIAWLEKRPAHLDYDFYCSGQCLIGQWMRSIDPGVSEPPFSGSFVYIVDGKEIDLEDRYSDLAVSEPWTFGAALDRARKALVS
jgi:hypothetical protein